MLKNFPISKFNHCRSVSTEFQMGCFLSIQSVVCHDSREKAF
ncbi:hypothetical protein T08_9714 [Trichinella sp. T8]|nr:hypothetical protein T08_9714 [Trichinella sp. T8]